MEKMTENLRRFKLIFWPDQEYQRISKEFLAITQQILEDALSEQFLQQYKQLHIQYDLRCPQRLGEEECDARIEYAFTIDSDGDGNNNAQLIHFFTALLQRCEERAGYDLIPTAIQLGAKQFFRVEFNAAHLMLPTRHCAFLNLMNRCQPVVHRLVQLTRDPCQIMSRYYNNAPLTCPMLTDFEHDRRQLVLQFPIKDVQYHDSHCVDADFVVTLTVRYQQIKRVLVHFTRSNQSAENKSNNNNNNMCLYLNLTSPPVIHRIRIHKRRTGMRAECAGRLMWTGDRYAAWMPSDKYMAAEVSESPVLRIQLADLSGEQCCQLLDRLAQCTERLLEFRIFSQMRERHLPFSEYVQSPLGDAQCRQECGDDFELLYMIAALLSRGAVVKDYLLAEEMARDEFVARCADDFKTNKKLTLECLEQTLAEIDKRLDSMPPLLIYDWVYRRLSRTAAENVARTIHEEMATDGYVRVRKVLITPTRTIFVAPELLMGNRVLRKYPLDKFLRVVFRDEDGQNVFAQNVGNVLIDRFIRRRLCDGIKIGDRTFNYFGSSNSQLRDNGCYFIAASFKEIDHILTELGSFRIQSAPKMMSRIAQCFTQAKETVLEIDRRFCATVHDYLGGRDSNGEPYNFSDGVGTISLELARRDMQLGACTPSCYQFRYRGYKGVLSVNRHLDAMREWGVRNGVADRTNFAKGQKKEGKKAKWRDGWLYLDLQFRPSQKKFRAPLGNQRLEIVKFSMPVPISLNRPVNNILDQVGVFL